MKIEVKDMDNRPVGEMELPEAIFAYPYKEHLIHTVMEGYRAALRRGTHSTKTRGEVAGGGRKPWRQKGTGRARAGSIRSPLWRTGGVTHGPRPRSYEKRISSREKRNALKSVLSRKLSLDGITVIDSLELESHKTGELARWLDALGVEGKVLLVDGRENENLGLAARNNPRLKTVDPLGVNVYDVIDRPHVLVSRQAMERLVEVLAK